MSIEFLLVAEITVTTTTKTTLTVKKIKRNEKKLRIESTQAEFCTEYFNVATNDCSNW